MGKRLVSTQLPGQSFAGALAWMCALTFCSVGEYGGGTGTTNTLNRRVSHVTQRSLPHRALNAGSG